MSQIPQDDQRLIHFLKQYHADAPEPVANLEEQIMAALDQDLVQESSRLSRSRRAIRAFKWVFSFMAAGLTLLWIGDRLSSQPSSLTAIEQSQLEGFIQTNWNEVMGETQETSWLTMLENSQD